MNLSELYDYMIRRLLQANLRNDAQAIEEVEGLLSNTEAQAEFHRKHLSGVSLMTSTVEFVTVGSVLRCSSQSLLERSEVNGISCNRGSPICKVLKR